MGLNKLAQEDPSFNYSRDEETGQTVIEGMGELHLEIIVDRLRREFKVCVGGSRQHFSYSAHHPAADELGMSPCATGLSVVLLVGHAGAYRSN